MIEANHRGTPNARDRAGSAIRSIWASDAGRVIQILVVASFSLFAFVFGNEADEFPVTDLIILLVMLAIIVIVQASILLAFDTVIGSRREKTRTVIMTKLFAACLIGANAYYTAFITYDSGIGTQILLAVGVGIFFLLVLFVSRIQSAVIFIGTMYVLLSLGLYTYTRVRMSRPHSSADIGLRVHSQRNVYFIGNESLGSPRAFRDVYGVAALPHIDYLKARGFRVLDSAYSADYKTLRSYSRILDFGRNVSEGDITNRVVFNYLNTTFSIFHHSGYKIQWIYGSTYFMLNRDVVDFALPRAAFYQCWFVPRRFFYVLCRPKVTKALNRILFGYKPLTAGVIENRIGVTASSGRPWLTIYHSSFPRHTVPSHSYTDAAAVRRVRNQYRAWLPEVKRRNFDTIIEYIRRTDPGAVIVTYGDHGAGLTRGATLDKPNKVFTQRQVLEDRFGVLLAVYPRDFCAKRIAEGMSTTYLVESVVRCLNGDDSPTPADRAKARTINWDGPRSLDRYAP